MPVDCWIALQNFLFLSFVIARVFLNDTNLIYTDIEISISQLCAIKIIRSQN